MKKDITPWLDLSNSSRPLPAHDSLVDEAVREISSVLFASLRRRDQRRKAEQYLTGLVLADGRKSIRNVAALVGDQATEQSLHHFISSSTWDWEPIREALAQYLESITRTRAWVVQTMPIPKAGRYSVGVDRQYFPELGQTVNGQRATGVWFAGEKVGVPVNWRLFLPPSWVGQKAKGHRANVPDGFPEETPVECALAAVDTVVGWRVPRRPVVLDAQGHDVGSVVKWSTETKTPVLARTSGILPLMVADPAMPGFGSGALPARRILAGVRGLRRPVRWADASGEGIRCSSAAAIRVRPPRRRNRLERSGSPGSGRELLLLGEWNGDRRSPERLWLSTMTSESVSTLIRMTKLVRSVNLFFDEVGDSVGMRDFEGRSFPGWHRHMTLASVAHAALAMSADSWSKWHWSLPW